ncbi:PD-(D/E)XK nuclease family protein [[Phormidium] sp. ETS-05]|uniref:RecB family exonuclease n=1 Tax=[Phormidium] sp. ETS-05 TaxID=222819 RepID=UPI0018EF038D|nr:PD-(D/E)XK nuclease family protein [[Phormidium] sp. ETS-05]
MEDPVIQSAYQAWRVEVRRESGALPDEYDGVVGLPLSVAKQKFSPSQLTNLGQCPFKWFADRVLRLAELTEAETELSMSLRGRLYHRCLDIACKLVVGLNYETKEELLNYLHGAFLEAEQKENLPTLPAWGARRQEHLTTLRQTILAPDFLSEGLSVLTTERRFEGEWYGLRVTGVIDRVDRTPDGLAIIDYKTSSQPPKGAKDIDDKLKLDIQLPLYKQLAETVLFPGEKVALAYYYSLTKGKILKKVDGDEEALAQFANNVKVRLQTGQFPVQPDGDREACRYCPYDLVCRAGSRLNRK